MIDDPVSLLQVLPSRFSARRFPPLRLDVEVDIRSGVTSINDEDGPARYVADGDPRGLSAFHDSTSDTSTKAPTNAADAARALVVRLRGAGGRVLLPQLLLVDRALETLLATEPRVGREQTIRRWAERWRLPRLRPRDQQHFSRLPADELGRLRVAMRVVESMAATGTVDSDSNADAPSSCT